MSIGDTLAEARRQAGLTVTQVSQRTCIRETIIRGIERGDFSACGGDFYARGHIRSIARAVGADPEALIREYDAQHGAPQAIRAADVFEPATPIKLKERRRPNWSAGHGPGAGRGRRLRDLPRGRSSSGALGQQRRRPADIDHSLTAHHHSQSGHPAATPSATPSAAQPQNVVISLTAIQDCWVEFTTTGRPVPDPGLRRRRQSKTWTFEHAVNMQIGNPGGVVLTVNGQEAGLAGLGRAARSR